MHPGEPPHAAAWARRAVVVKRYKLGAVIGTWTLCDCGFEGCKRMPLHSPGRKQIALPRPSAAQRRKRAAA